MPGRRFVVQGYYKERIDELEFAFVSCEGYKQIFNTRLSSNHQEENISDHI